MDRVQKITENMNELTEKFKKTLDISEEMVLNVEDVEHFVEASQIEPNNLQDGSLDTIHISNLLQDFQYARKTLKDNIDSGREVLKYISQELTDSDDETRASLIMSFAELNKALVENIKLFLGSYKSIADVLVTLQKLNADTKEEQTTENDMNATTIDLIKSITEK